MKPEIDIESFQEECKTIWVHQRTAKSNNPKEYCLHVCTQLLKLMAVQLLSWQYKSLHFCVRSPESGNFGQHSQESGLRSLTSIGSTTNRLTITVTVILVHATSWIATGYLLNHCLPLASYLLNVCNVMGNAQKLRDYACKRLNAHTYT